MLPRATAALAGALRRVAGEPITYRRGSQAAEIDGAVRGRSEWETTDPTGIPLVTHTTDWLLDTAALQLDGQPIEPRAGDRIEAAGEHYEVRHPAGDNPFRYSDHAATRIRIHSQRRPP